MAQILLFHHAQGQTPGFLAFANELGTAGRVVHAPDLYDDKTFAGIDEGGGWPQGVPLQIHMMADDPWVKEDLSAARELAATVDGAELFLYPGDRHLFADNSLPDYDEHAATLLTKRVLAFLKAIE